MVVRWNIKALFTDETAAWNSFLTKTCDILWNFCIGNVTDEIFGDFLVRIFTHLDWIRTDLSIFSPDAEKYGLKKLRIRTLFTQWWRHCLTYLKQFQSTDWRLKHLLTGFLQKSEILTSICRNTRLFKNKPLWNILKWFSAKNERPMTTLMFCQ